MSTTAPTSARRPDDARSNPSNFFIADLRARRRSWRCGSSVSDVSPWIAIAIGLLLPFAIHAVPLGIEFIVGALIDRRPIARLNVVDALRLWLVESWRSFVVFNIDQPWRANFPERPIVKDAARPAVLLVHGYMCNRASWRHWVLLGLPATGTSRRSILNLPMYPSSEYAAVVGQSR